MGLFSRKIKHPVRGTAQIVSCSRHGGDGRWQNCRMQLVVHVDGNDPYPAEVHQIAPRAKWPQPGLTVPVDVDPKDRARVKVVFDEMEDTRDLARRLAEQQAAQAGQVPGTAPRSMVGGAMSPQVNIIGDPSDLPPEKLAQVEQMLGMDLNGDGQVGGVAAPRGAPASDGDDRIAQLERLAALRASGALSEEEFQQEKQRLLGS